MKYILAIDQGTTSSRAIVFDKQGHIITIAQKEFEQIFPKEGWVEHNPMEILDTIRWAINEVVYRVGAENIASVGITNQRETTVVWNKKTGIPVYNALVWQSRQSVPQCEALKEAGLAKSIHEKTGLLVDAYFSGSKIKWIFDNVPGTLQQAQKGELLFGTIDTWLLWNLSNEKNHATDYTNASRTMLFNIHEKKWDAEICDALKVPASMLPTVHNCSHNFGTTRKDIFGRDDITIAGMAGDQQAALFGQTCFETGDAKNTYGTGCFMLMNTGAHAITSHKGLLTTIAWGLDDEITYALEGSVFVAGSAVKFLRDNLEIIEHAAETEKMSNTVDSNGGVIFVPAFVGLGTPYWDSSVRGAIFGLTRGTTKAHIARATLESIAYQTKDVLMVMVRESKTKLKTLRVDGGAVANNFLMQFQSNILHVPIERPVMQESTALGAAYFAGLQVGYWKDLNDIAHHRKVDKIFTPNMAKVNREKLYKSWKAAVRAARAF